MKEEKEEKGEIPLAGKKFVFTGGLEHFSRQEANDLVGRLGARAISSLSKSVDYVVAGENPGSKYEKAKSLGLNILTEKEFEEIIKGVERK